MQKFTVGSTEEMCGSVRVRLEFEIYNNYPHVLCVCSVHRTILLTDYRTNKILLLRTGMNIPWILFFIFCLP